MPFEGLYMPPVSATEDKASFLMNILHFSAFSWQQDGPNQKWIPGFNGVWEGVIHCTQSQYLGMGWLTHVADGSGQFMLHYDFNIIC